MPRPVAIALCLLLTLGWVGTVLANEAMPMADDPDLEVQVQRISRDLRCLVCQNETIAASQSLLAIDLREQVRSQLRQGRTDEQIREYMVARFGDFVLYRPPLNGRTWLLWAGPFLLLFSAAWVFRRTVLAQAKQGAEAPDLSPEDNKIALQLLKRGPT